MLSVSKKTLHDLEWHRVTEALAERADTEMGREVCLEPPFHTNTETLRHQLTAVDEVRLLMDRGEPPRIGGVYSVAGYLPQAQKRIFLDVEPLQEIASTMEAGNRLRGYFHLHRDHAPTLAEIAGRLQPLTESLQRIRFTIDPETGRIQDYASEELNRLRKEAAGLHRRLKERLDSMMRDQGVLSALQDEYFTLRDDRYVLPVRSGEKNEVDGIVHGHSQTGQTLYIEPREMVEMNNRLKMVDMAIRREERRILLELTDAVAEESEPLLRNLDILTDLDVFIAKARLAEEMDGSMPEVLDTPGMVLRGARHPILLLDGLDVVANDLAIGEDFAVLVLSGVNTGGKTVTLKTLGLCALMLRAGLHPPVAPGSRIGVFHEIVTAMGDEQSIEDRLSTFSANIANLNRILESCDERTLVLLDEIIIGTDPVQGAALAQAMLEGIAGRKARCVVTTHYDRLKQLAYARNDFANAAVGIGENSQRPNYRVTIGIPGASSAFQVAKELGVLTEVLDRARNLVQDNDSQLNTMVQKLQLELEHQQSLRRELEEQHDELSRQKDELLSKQRELDEEIHTLRRERKQAVNEEIRKAQDDVKAIVRNLQRGGGIKQANQTLADLRERERRMDKELNEMPLPAVHTHRNTDLPHGVPGNRHDPSLPGYYDLQAGTTVHLHKLGQNGTIIEPPDNRGLALVEVGRLKMRVAAEDLSWAEGEPMRTEPSRLPDLAEQLGRAMESKKPDEPTPAAALRCDLRGERVEEALEMTENFLDRARRERVKLVTVIHGHGTGRLKAAVRTFLRESSYVKEWRPGERGEGGDGVSMVTLDLD